VPLKRVPLFNTLQSLLPYQMSSSWNFPARAEPSYKGSEPSQAELGHFNFRAEIELTIHTICMSKNSKFLTYFSHMVSYLILCKIKGIFEIEKYDFLP
jgi:hypothetical protein